MSSLIGKTRDQIERALADKDRPALLDVIYKLTTLEPHFTISDVARARKLSRGAILDKLRTGAIKRAHRPLKNAYRIPLSALQDWDRSTQCKGKNGDD